jgi:hypothetical protein
MSRPISAPIRAQVRTTDALRLEVFRGNGPAWVPHRTLPHRGTRGPCRLRGLRQYRDRLQQRMRW